MVVCVEDVDARVYHMGTKRDGDRLLTAGGRVMMVVAEGKDTRAAWEKVYAEIGKIHCDNLFHRRDIAHWALDGKVLDGKALAASIKDELRDRVGKLEVKYGRKPSLAVIIVGNNPASQVYVRNKVKSAIYVGMNSRLITMAEDASEEALLRMIDDLNRDPEVDGILVQLPLPRQINEARVIDAIAKEKDVDGFHPGNVSDLWLGRPCILPCTPKGIVRLIDESGIDLTGKTAVVVGRSNIVGKPVAKLLLDRNATVIIAHSRTRDLKSITLQADVLVVAVGKVNVVTGDMVKPGAVVIDVGMNRDAEGHLCGDVDYVGARLNASWITPVPGGVGPMTIAMLMENTVECFLARIDPQ